jgi:hypothetical protein
MDTIELIKLSVTTSKIPLLGCNTNLCDSILSSRKWKTVR